MEGMTTFSLMLHLMQEGKKLFSMYNTKLRQMRIDSSPVAVQYHLLPSLSSEFHSWRFDLFLPSSAGRETPASFNIARRRVVVGRSRERRSAIIDPFPSLRRDGATGRERERGVINLPLRGQFSAVPIFVVIEENREGGREWDEAFSRHRCSSRE